MDRNTLTTLDLLSVGDRFYKHGDKAKQVMSVLSTRALVWGHSTCIAPPGQPSHSILAKTVKSPALYKVVFLRHENEPV